MRNKKECAIIVKIHTNSRGMARDYEKQRTAISAGERWQPMAVKKSRLGTIVSLTKSLLLAILKMAWWVSC